MQRAGRFKIKVLQGACDHYTVAKKYQNNGASANNLLHFFVESLARVFRGFLGRKLLRLLFRTTKLQPHLQNITQRP